jgi:hypothetical protein
LPGSQESGLKSALRQEAVTAIVSAATHHPLAGARGSDGEWAVE